jgi:hypothetical protein
MYTDYTILATDTLMTLAGTSNPITSWLAALRSNLSVPVSISLIHPLANWGSLCSLYFEDLYVDLYTKSTLKIQNVSLALVDDYDAQDVNSVHLTGRMYRFKNAHPRTTSAVAKATAQNLMEVDVNVGVTAFGASTSITTSVGGSALREPPNASFFTNLKGNSKINIKPGEIKSDTIISRMTMSFENYLINNPASIAQGLETQNYSGKGVFNLVALEKIIHVPNQPVITVNGEVQKTVGCVIKERSRRSGALQVFQPWTMGVPN